jgi:GTP-binding protein
VDPWQLDENGEALDPMKSFEMINKELHSYSEILAQKPQVVLLTKSDAATEDAELEKIKKRFQKKGLECLIASSVTGQGIPDLIELLAIKVTEARKLSGNNSPISDSEAQDREA